MKCNSNKFNTYITAREQSRIMIEQTNIGRGENASKWLAPFIVTRGENDAAY